MPPQKPATGKPLAVASIKHAPRGPARPPHGARRSVRATPADIGTVAAAAAAVLTPAAAAGAERLRTGSSRRAAASAARYGPSPQRPSAAAGAQRWGQASAPRRHCQGEPLPAPARCCSPADAAVRWLANRTCPLAKPHGGPLAHTAPGAEEAAVLTPLPWQPAADSPGGPPRHAGGAAGPSAAAAAGAGLGRLTSLP